MLTNPYASPTARLIDSESSVTFSRPQRLLRVVATEVNIVFSFILLLFLSSQNGRPFVWHVLSVLALFILSACTLQYAIRYRSVVWTALALNALYATVVVISYATDAKAESVVYLIAGFPAAMNASVIAVLRVSHVRLYASMSHLANPSFHGTLRDEAAQRP